VRVESTLADALSILGREAARIVLPSWCAVCEEELPWRERRASCCARCWSALPRITTAKCASCALPLTGGEGDRLLCIECLIDPLPVVWNEAWGHYRGGLQRLLAAFKFRRHDFLDQALAALLESTLRLRGDLAFDRLLPVPMHRRKERRRGYNQAELLARALAGRLAIPCKPSLLTKSEERTSQSTLPREARKANVRDLFHASSDVAGRSLLLIDDICTTGETLRACAAELTRAGAGRVCAITVAKAGA
jgi:ComF family protein